MTDTKRDEESRGVAVGEQRPEPPEDAGSDREPLEDDPISIASPSIGTAEQRNVRSVLESGNLANGEVVTTFERSFADYCGVDHGVATSNGTTALHAALEAVEIGDGDRVLTTPFSFIATANAIRLTGATPLFADVDPRTFNLDPAAIERRVAQLDGGIDAILAVHLFGLPAPMEELREIADDHDAVLIEDAAQAHGATYRGNRTGSLADAACFSFYPTKNMTTGEGGMVVTDREDLDRRLRRFVDHGREPGAPSVHRELGHNFRMTNIAAALGHVQIERLPTFIERRRENAAVLTDRLSETPVTTPVEPAHSEHAYHQYTIRTSERDALRAHLEDFGVQTGVYYPTPIHQQPAYTTVVDRFEAAERAAMEVLSLPVHPELSSRDVSTIATAIRHYFTDE